MATQGTTFVDFGTGAGSDRATVAVTGQASILASSLVEAWPSFDASLSDIHTEDDLQRLARDVSFVVPKSLIVAGTGFTIVAICNDKSGMRGKLPVNWVWN